MRLFEVGDWLICISSVGVKDENLKERTFYQVEATTQQFVKLFGVVGWYRAIRFDFASNANTPTIKE